MATFSPGAYQQRSEYNYVSALSLHKPDVDSVLTRPYGTEKLSGMMDVFGTSKATSSLEYIHHEKDRLMPKVSVATSSAGASAGAAVTDFTLDTSGAGDSVGSFTNNTSPNFDSTSASYNPLRVNDLILMKPASGTVNAQNYIRAIVTARTDAGVFTIAPLDSADTLPAITASTEVVIYGNAHGEGSAQPEARSTTTTQYTNQLQIVKDTFEITGSENDVVLWTKVVDPTTGKSGYVWRVEGEGSTAIQFLNYREMVMLLGENANNDIDGVSNSIGDDTAPMSYTDGLINFILDGGNIANYSGVTGLTLQDMEDIVVELDKQKGAKNNMFMCGIELSLQLDRELADRFTQGALVYGNYNGAASKSVSLEFDTFRVGQYTFNKKTYQDFNDLQTLGAAGYGFPFEGMIIPMDNQIDGKSRESVPSLRKRYLANPETGESREFKTTTVSLFEKGDTGQDVWQTRYLSHCGFEGFASNRFYYVQRSA